MSLILKNSEIYTEEKVVSGDFVSADALSVSSFETSSKAVASEGDEILNNCFVLPGFCDVHVHFREPGFLYKEDTATGSAAAAAGGYTAVCTMPNLKPVPDSVENLSLQLSAIKEKAKIGVYPYGAITVGQMGEKLADLEGMADNVIAFSDDGRGVQSEDMMLEAMKRAKALGKMIVAHCEDNSLLRGGYIHDGKYAASHGHRGICSESEWRPIERDLKLAAKTGCRYHVCHVSAKESVALIREAKRAGIDVTCETAPHYLLLDDSNLTEDARFKMNPPLRDESDREALIEGILDGTVDMIATDHAPHSSEEKSRGLEKSLMGVVGLETAFPVLYTGLVKKGIIDMPSLMKLMAYNPRARFGISDDVGFSVWNISDGYNIDPESFKTMGRSTPFAGEFVYGKCLMTVWNGKTVHKESDI